MSEPLIHIENLYKSFGRQTVLAGIDIDISAGESVAIIGRSGSGKSVLLKHILKLLIPDRGRVLFDGMDVGKVNGRPWSRCGGGSACSFSRRRCLIL